MLFVSCPLFSRLDQRALLCSVCGRLFVADVGRLGFGLLRVSFVYVGGRCIAGLSFACCVVNRVRSALVSWCGYIGGSRACQISHHRIKLVWVGMTMSRCGAG